MVEYEEKNGLVHEYLDARKEFQMMLCKTRYNPDVRLSDNQTLFEVYQGYMKDMEENGRNEYIALIDPYNKYKSSRFTLVAALKPFLESYLVKKGLHNLNPHDAASFETGLEQAVDRMPFLDEDYIVAWLDSKYTRYKQMNHPRNAVSEAETSRIFCCERLENC